MRRPSLVLKALLGVIVSASAASAATYDIATTGVSTSYNSGTGALTTLLSSPLWGTSTFSPSVALQSPIGTGQFSFAATLSGGNFTTAANTVDAVGAGNTFADPTVSIAPTTGTYTVMSGATFFSFTNGFTFNGASLTEPIVLEIKNWDPTKASAANVEADMMFGSPVPLPNSALAIGSLLAIAGLGAFRRRRSHANI